MSALPADGRRIDASPQWVCSAAGHQMPGWSVALPGTAPRSTGSGGGAEHRGGLIQWYRWHLRLSGDGAALWFQEIARRQGLMRLCRVRTPACLAIDIAFPQEDIYARTSWPPRRPGKAPTNRVSPRPSCPPCASCLSGEHAGRIIAGGEVALGLRGGGVVRRWRGCGWRTALPPTGDGVVPMIDVVVDTCRARPC